MNASKKRIAVLVSGGGTNMQAVIEGIDSGAINAEIVLVISSNDKAFALQRAKNNNIPAFVCALKDYNSGSERDEAVLRLIKKYRADYVLLAGYLGILGAQIVSEFRHRIINIHPALLPKFGGKAFHGEAVHRAVIEAGEKISGATVHFVDENIDTGLIIAQRSLPVLESDTPKSLQERILNTIEHSLLTDTLADLCNDKIQVENGRLIYGK